MGYGERGEDWKNVECKGRHFSVSFALEVVTVVVVMMMMVSLISNLRGRRTLEGGREGHLRTGGIGKEIGVPKNTDVGREQELLLGYGFPI